MSKKADFSLAFCNEADPEHYYGEMFFSLAFSRSHAHRC
jgi:hypothetical protein